MKKIFKIIGVVLIPIYIAVFTFYVFPDINKNAEEIEIKKTEILELWHIDMFEGGSGSRSDFLRQRAIEFEKNNENIYILVKTLSYEQLIYNLLQGYMPDLFSYGKGLANVILPEICAFSGNITGFSNMIESGVIEDRAYGIPWCTGGYIIAGINEYLINTSADFTAILTSSYKQRSKGLLYSFTTGYSMFNNPLLAAFEAGGDILLSGNSFKENVNYTQFEAYMKFVSKTESVFLLGTQRDAVRIMQRDNFADYSMQAVPGFTDLICYISTAKTSDSLSAGNKFIEYLLGDNSQKKLTDINMFSVTTQGLYSEGIMQQIENKVIEYRVLNAFTAQEILLENRNIALNALKGDNVSIKKIWEMLP